MSKRSGVGLQGMSSDELRAKIKHTEEQQSRLDPYSHAWLVESKWISTLLNELNYAVRDEQIKLSL